MKKLKPHFQHAFPEAGIGQVSRPIKVSYPAMVSDTSKSEVVIETGGAASAIRETLYARLSTRKILVTVSAQKLNVPIPVVEAFAKGTGMVTADILQAMARLLWGESVTYSADHDALYRNGEKFTPEVELNAKLKEEIRLRVAARAAARGELNEQRAKLKEEIRVRVKARAELIDLSAKLEEEIRVCVKARDELIELSVQLAEEIRLRVAALDEQTGAENTARSKRDAHKEAAEKRREALRLHRLSLTPEGRKAKREAKEKERLKRLSAHGKDAVF